MRHFIRDVSDDWKDGLELVESGLEKMKGNW